MSEFATSEVRAYRAKSQAVAEELMAADIAPMAQQGLAPSQRVWTEPQSWRAIATPIVLTLVGFVLFGLVGGAGGALIGIAYMLLVRPKGTLTVTFSQSRSLMPAWSSMTPGPVTMSFAEPMRATPWSRQRR